LLFITAEINSERCFPFELLDPDVLEEGRLEAVLYRETFFRVEFE
jgi:hypothetical protein